MLEGVSGMDACQAVFIRLTKRRHDGSHLRGYADSVPNLGYQS